MFKKILICFGLVPNCHSVVEVLVDLIYLRFRHFWAILNGHMHSNTFGIGFWVWCKESSIYCGYRTFSICSKLSVGELSTICWFCSILPVMGVIYQSVVKIFVVSLFTSGLKFTKRIFEFWELRWKLDVFISSKLHSLVDC